MYLGEMLSIEERTIFQQDLQQIFDDFTTIEMLQKLAPCGSSQKNEALHSMVISLASKSLHLGRSNSYLGRYSLAVIKMFKDNDVGSILLQQLGIEVGFYTDKQIKKKNNLKKERKNQSQNC